ncbi:MAG: hypothetical protein HY083_05705 [Gammaproteobacteria bacterium]|nr:hypothetical protein [Gammaproteobacteria bacterium]
MSARTLSFYRRTCVPDDGLVPPYGGTLVQAFVPATDRLAARARLQRLPAISLSTAELHDLEMLGSGAYSPLAGFMTRSAYGSVLEQGALPDGLPWGLPVMLTVSAATARALTPGNEVALVFGAEPVGFLQIEEIYPWDPATEAGAVYNDSDPPAIAARRARGGAYLVGGAVSLLAARGASWLHARHQWPLEMRNAFARHGWRHMGAIHARHPWQRVHEYLLRCALESLDALLSKIRYRRTCSTKPRAPSCNTPSSARITAAPACSCRRRRRCAHRRRSCCRRRRSAVSRCGRCSWRAHFTARAAAVWSRKNPVRTTTRSAS